MTKDPPTKDLGKLWAERMTVTERDQSFPDSAPRDAEWGERFFHITDPDGHQLSFAWPQGRTIGGPLVAHRLAGQ